MEQRFLNDRYIQRFAKRLVCEEKSPCTIEKYLRDLRSFWIFLGDEAVTKERVVSWKNSLVDRGYAVRSVNSMLASVNSFFGVMGWCDCKVKNIRIQQQIYCAEEKELTKAEYLRLLEASKKNERLHLVLQTICGTGIRVSELRYFTVEAVQHSEISVSCKGKNRKILLPGKLRNMLLKFARKHGIDKGMIFVTSRGSQLDRSNIWAAMKKLCGKAGVEPSKVFPHNLRKLFARTFYDLEKDIAKLADILGHSSVNTTRIYIVSTGMEHRRKLERLGLVL